MKYTKDFLLQHTWMVHVDSSSGERVADGIKIWHVGPDGEKTQIEPEDTPMRGAAVIIACCNPDWVQPNGICLDTWGTPESLYAIWAGISVEEAKTMIALAADEIVCPIRQEAEKTRQQLIDLGMLPVDGVNDGVHEGLRQAQELCHSLASKSGWWTDRASGNRKTRDQVNIAEKLCLIHSEISEAMEGDRKDLNDDHLPHRKMLEVELADALIRIFDLAGFLDLDLAGATLEKLAYNQQRADHKLANRSQAGGKAY